MEPILITSRGLYLAGEFEFEAARGDIEKNGAMTKEREPLETADFDQGVRNIALGSGYDDLFLDTVRIDCQRLSPHSDPDKMSHYNGARWKSSML